MIPQEVRDPVPVEGRKEPDRVMVVNTTPPRLVSSGPIGDPERVMVVNTTPPRLVSSVPFGTPFNPPKTNSLNMITMWNTTQA